MAAEGRDPEHALNKLPGAPAEHREADPALVLRERLELLFRVGSAGDQERRKRQEPTQNTNGRGNENHDDCSCFTGTPPAPRKDTSSRARVAIYFQGGVTSPRSSRRSSPGRRAPRGTSSTRPSGRRCRSSPERCASRWTSRCT